MEYLSWDTDWRSDPKVRILERHYGPSAALIYQDICLFAARENGYFCTYSDTLIEYISFGYVEKGDEEAAKNLVNSVIMDCLKIGLFDAGGFRRVSALTCRRIQKAYAAYRKRSVEQVVDKSLFIPTAEKAGKVPPPQNKPLTCGFVGDGNGE